MTMCFFDIFKILFGSNEEEKKENLIVKNNCSYELKNSYITASEKEYYNYIKNILKEKYIILPQINLASIITKKSEEFTRQNELFRNIDLGIFTKDFKPVLLIEINDNSHNQPKRRERDAKVKEICEAAKIPLITFWLSKGFNEWYIKKKITEIIKDI